MPPEVLAKEGKLLTRADPTIEIGDYRFSAVLGKDESVWVRITTPNFTIHEPKNPSLKIVGIPLVVETNASRDHPLEGEITLPFAALEGFDNESLEVYSYERSDWRSLPGVHNKTTHTVTWHIPDLHARTDRSGIAVFGILGIACPNCVETEFKKIYDPGTRNAIVMVHGLLSSPLSWQLIIDDFSLNEQPWQMWTYGYRSSRTITELADDLKNSLELNSGQYDTLYLIGHSLGGLVIEEAVASAHNSSVAGERDFSFLKKVRKVITIGSPHEGSPAAAVYDNFFKNLVSQQGVTVAGGASRELLKELEKGRAAPEVPGIKYYVLAGTRPYEFNVGLFTVKAEDILTLVGKNDGITTVPSAQMVGGRQVNNSCEDYFEMNLTHTDLTDHPISRKVMARIITEDIKQQKERGVVGYNQYLRVEIPQCQMGETFVVVGKKIDPLAAKSVLGCGCGNGVCGVDESEESCPQDCAVVAMVSPLERFIYYASRAVVILFILFIVAYGIHRKRRRALPPSERRTPLRSLLKNLAHKAQGLVSQLSAAKSQGSWVPPQAPPPPTRPVLTLPSPRVPLSPSPTPQSHLVIPQVPFEWRSLLRPSQVPSLNVPPKIPSRAPQEKVPLMRAPLPPLQNPAPKPAPTLLPKPVPTQAQRLYPIVRKAAEVAQKGRAIASSISAQRPNIIKRFRIWWSCPRAQKPLPPRPIVQKALSQKPVPQKQTTSLRPLQRPLPQGPARGFVHLQNRIKEIKQASSRPSFHMPAISMPKFTLPSMPKIAWPTFKKRSLPSVDLFKARKAYLPARDTHKEDMEKLRKSIAELDAKLKKVRRLNR